MRRHLDKLLRPRLHTLQQLRSDILNRRTQSEFPEGSDRDYFPAGQLSELITQKTIRSILSDSKLQKLVEYVWQHARSFFVMLVATGQAAFGRNGDEFVKILEACRASGMTDKFLPIKIKEMGCVGRAGTGQCSGHPRALDIFHEKIWSTTLKEDFHTYQPTFYPPPVFTIDRFRYNVPTMSVLPFRIAKGGGRKSGHFSDVYKVGLHQSHCDSKLAEGVSTFDDDLRVAIKKLKLDLPDADYDVPKAWNNEVSALEQLRKLAHPHLIKPMAAIEHGANRYIMFEWADGGSLRQIWHEQPGGAPSLDSNRVKCVLEQLHGLAGALSTLHKRKTKAITATGSATESSTSYLGRKLPRLQLPSDDREGIDDREEHWRHGDLKPDNILSVKGPKSNQWLGTLKIADLGLAKRHIMETERRIAQTQQKYTTLQYEGPETLVNPELPRSRRFDIWSMGCIILEFVIHLLYGKEGLDIFTKEQHRASFDKSTETLYFTVRDRVADVSSIAKHWISQILHHPECKDRDSAIRDLVELVEQDLLVVNMRDETTKCRATAEELEKSLEQLKKKASENSDYLCGIPYPAIVEGPTSSPEIFSSESTKKAARVAGRTGNTLGDDLRPIAQNLVLYPANSTSLKNTANGF